MVGCERERPAMDELPALRDGETDTHHQYSQCQLGCQNTVHLPQETCINRGDSEVCEGFSGLTESQSNLCLPDRAALLLSCHGRVEHTLQIHRLSHPNNNAESAGGSPSRDFPISAHHGRSGGSAATEEGWDGRGEDSSSYSGPPQLSLGLVASFSLAAGVQSGAGGRSERDRETGDLRCRGFLVC